MRRIRFGMALLALLAGGCAGQVASVGGAVKEEHAECLVCKHNADLGCVDLTVEKDTPRSVYMGKTYYFCSDECKAAFEKSPGKYVAAK